MRSIQATPSRVPLFLSLLVAFHIAIVIASNYLVQLPITLLGFHSTWGAFSFPFIFLATDLTVRLIGKQPARRVITRAMLPALVASYIVGVLFHEGGFNGWGALADFNSFVFRIAFASFAAYVLGQLLDIQVFDRIRQRSSAWWLAPAAAIARGSLPESALNSVRETLATTLSALGDSFFSGTLLPLWSLLSVSLLLFVPAYGVMLAAIVRTMRTPPAPAAA